MEKRLIDRGMFYITNKRYIFDGSSKKMDEVFAGDMDEEYIGAVISGIVKNIK